MPSILLTPPAVEPVSLDEAKDYLRVAHGDDDAVIIALIASARAHVEAQTRRALITQVWRHSLDMWPLDDRVLVLPAPLQGLAAVRVYDEAGAAQTIGLESFVVDTISAPGVVYLRPWSVPGPGRRHAGIELDTMVGYGDAGVDVPPSLKLAIRMLVAHWYENRGVVAESGAVPRIASIADLIVPYRVLSL